MFGLSKFFNKKSKKNKKKEKDSNIVDSKYVKYSKETAKINPKLIKEEYERILNSKKRELTNNLRKDRFTVGRIERNNPNEMNNEVDIYFHLPNDNNERYGDYYSYSLGNSLIAIEKNYFPPHLCKYNFTLILDTEKIREVANSLLDYTKKIKEKFLKVRKEYLDIWEEYEKFCLEYNVETKKGLNLTFDLKEV